MAVQLVANQADAESGSSGGKVMEGEPATDTEEVAAALTLADTSPLAARIIRAEAEREGDIETREHIDVPGEIRSELVEPEGDSGAILDGGRLLDTSGTNADGELGNTQESAGGPADGELGNTQEGAVCTPSHLQVPETMPTNLPSSPRPRSRSCRSPVPPEQWRHSPRLNSASPGPHSPGQTKRPLSEDAEETGRNKRVKDRKSVV